MTGMLNDKHINYAVIGAIITLLGLISYNAYEARDLCKMAKTTQISALEQMLCPDYKYEYERKTIYCNQDERGYCL